MIMFNTSFAVDNQMSQLLFSKASKKMWNCIKMNMLPFVHWVSILSENKCLAKVTNCQNDIALLVLL